MAFKIGSPDPEQDIFLRLEIDSAGNVNLIADDGTSHQTLLYLRPNGSLELLKLSSATARKWKLEVDASGRMRARSGE